MFKVSELSSRQSYKCQLVFVSKSSRVFDPLRSCLPECFLPLRTQVHGQVHDDAMHLWILLLFARPDRSVALVRKLQGARLGSARLHAPSRFVRCVFDGSENKSVVG